MKTYNYLYREHWSGLIDIYANSKKEADKEMNNLIAEGRIDTLEELSIDHYECELFSVKDENGDETFTDGSYPLPERLRLTDEEITMISDALIGAMEKANKASCLVVSCEVGEAIDKYIDKLQSLNRKMLSWTK